MLSHTAGTVFCINFFISKNKNMFGPYFYLVCLIDYGQNGMQINAQKTLKAIYFPKILHVQESISVDYT